MSNEPSSGLWDSFWAEHASSDRLFHRLLWRIRFLFSRAYAHSLLSADPQHSPDRLLEVGCGSARTLHYLSLRLPRSYCYALDLSAQALRIVRPISPGFLVAVA